ncbi:DEAD/DEAH box helicase [Comamonas sp. 23]|uniref:DEAD/DEAH box helicase n=1 Tax=Comamonas sp. 23 TaxID=3415008 RepID=UPI003C6FFA8B
MSSTIHETIEQLHVSLKDYIEATYHIADPKLISQRRSLLDLPGVIHQVPYLESTPKYRSGRMFREIKGLSAGAREAFELLSTASEGQPKVIHDPAYTHQVKSIASTLVEGRNLVIMTGTGSGKTESFLLPILGKLAREASERPKVFGEQHAMRALVLYPMNALVNDQLGRMRAMFGDPRLAHLFAKWSGRPARFARYTSRTPYAGVRSRKKDQTRLKSFEEFYVDLERATKNADDPKHELAVGLKNELKSRGKWPAKPDLVDWFGAKNSLWEDKDKKPLRAVTKPFDVELVTRHEVQSAPPDLLVTNYSMLEYMLMRPIERAVFDKTAEWLKRNPNETFLVVLDEAHLYRGAPGAEVGLLLRRLRARLGIGVERLQVICATASFDDKNYAPSFGAQLSGAPSDSFVPITGDLATAEFATVGSEADAKILAAVDLDAFYGAPTLRKLAVKRLLTYLGTEESNDVERDLFNALAEFPPLGQLINLTMGNATPLEELGGLVFPGVAEDIRDRAVTSLLALSSVARPTASAAGLLPCRVHNFFRGLPGLWVCLDAACSELAEDERNGSCGKLYAQPRERCGCDAQVLEYFTCRNCGSSYARGYTDNVESPRHLWSHAGSKLKLNTGEVEPLFPLDLMLETEPLKTDVVELKTLDLVTAALDPKNGGSRTREVFLRKNRSSGAADEDGNRDTRVESRGQFVPCGMCGGFAAFGHSTVQDHQTKGDQPFQTLVARQLHVQPPGQQEGSAFAPLQGRKVLAFSDSRQVAARLAPNLQMYSTRDALRPMLVLGFERLGAVEAIRPKLSLDDAYLAVLLAAATRNVRLRPELIPGESIAAVDTVRAAIRADGNIDDEALFNLWIDMKANKAPSSLLEDIYKSLFDKHLGLEPLAFASLSLRGDKLKKLSELPMIAGVAETSNEKLELVEAWLRCWWRASSGGVWMRDMPQLWWQRPKSSGTSVQSHKGSFEPLKKFLNDKNSVKCFTNEWLPKLMAELTEQVEASQRRILASNLALRFGGAWQRCATCTSVHRPVSRLHRCLDCGSSRVSVLDPDSDEAFMARKGNYRKPVIETKAGAPLLSLIAAEHTAQLNSAGSEEAFSRAEEHELLFQDVELVWNDIIQNPTAIDVLSSTTTMEVGIDIGALSGVALRNMPPGRANYQQRAGRAGRRGNAVATVVSFGSADSHDEHYFSNPQAMVSGSVVDPKLALANADIAQRHVRAFLLQSYHQSRVLQVNPGEANDLFSVLGTVHDFKSDTGRLNRLDFEAWLGENKERLQESLRDWLPVELGDLKERLVAGMAEDCLEAVDTAIADDEAPRNERESDEEGDVDAGENGFEEGEERPTVGAAPATLLNRLLYFGVLPRYAFPTDVATFTVFDERSNSFRHIARFSPSQSLPIALSQYAPGKEVWIANKCYTSAAVYSPIRSERTKAFKERMTYRECSTCGFAETKDVSIVPKGTVSNCIACGDTETFGPAQYWMRPPGFAHPYNRAPVTSPDDSPDTAYATRAKLMIPTPAETAAWLDVNERVRVYSSRPHLLVSNTGPEKKGYTYCSWCGCIEADTDPAPKLRGQHTKPFPDDEPDCDGMHATKNLVLGTKFITDVALFSLRLARPLELRPGTYPTNVALRTACEALAKAAASMLGVEPGEVLAEYRPAITEDSLGREGLQAEIFLYDTLPGGAGFSRLASLEAPRLLSLALDAVRNCPGGCDSSCYRCLRSFKNKIEHRLLDRHVGAELLGHLQTGDIPGFEAARIGAATDLLMSALAQQADGETYEGNVVVPNVGTVPLVATRANGSKVAVLLAAPLSGEVPLDEEMFEKLSGASGWTVVVVNELLVRHHLPAACQRVRDEVVA